MSDMPFWRNSWALVVFCLFFNKNKQISLEIIHSKPKLPEVLIASTIVLVYLRIWTIIHSTEEPEEQSLMQMSHQDFHSL